MLAAYFLFPLAGFNTQPPEGGWGGSLHRQSRGTGFNTQPPEGGWAVVGGLWNVWEVSTHSRLKAAGASHCTASRLVLFQHTAA